MNETIMPDDNLIFPPPPSNGAPSGTPSGPNTPPPPKPPRSDRSSWARLKARANSVSGVITLLLVVLLVGAAIGWGLSLFRSNKPTTTNPTISTLSPDDIKKLTDIGTNLGTSNQTLNIGANALFRNTVNITGDLTVGGRFNANGPVTLSQLNISGTTALAGLSVGSNLTVTGVTTLQKSLTVNDLVAINGGLNVSGTASVNALNASNISVKTISISGPLLISHLVSQGTAPTATAGGAVGSGGTISLSGNDTAGTLNINTGSGPAAGVLMTVVFRATYTGTPHVVLSPLTGASASLPAYVTRTATGFQVRVDSAPSAGSVFAYDYVVMQ